MFLKQKVSICVILCFIFSVILTVFISLFVVLPGFRVLQEEEAKEDVLRCIHAINREVTHLSLLALDWGAWTDTYEFVEDKNTAYIESNLDDIFDTSDLNLLYLYNISGEVIWGKAYDLKEKKFIKIKQFRENKLPEDHFILNHKSLNSEIKGIIETEYGPMLIASRPITKSDQTGPVKGTIIMGRLLTPKLIDKIIKQIGVRFKIRNSASSKLTKREATIIKEFESKNENYIIDAKSALLAFGRLVDINKTHSYLIIADIDNKIIEKGHNVVLWFLLASFLSIFVLGLVYYTIINCVVLKKIAILHENINLISKTGDISLITKIANNENKRPSDEVDLLAKSFFEMLNKLEVIEEDLRHATEVKNEFLANMSHEIRTPMNAIIGFGNMLAEEKLTENQMGYVNTICTAGENLLILINDILDFSKIEAGKLEIEFRPFETSQLLNHIDSLMRPMAINKKIDFQIMQKSELPAKLNTDFTRLCQCLINLCNNAIKFTAEGHVYIMVRYDEENEIIQFDVEDTGIGVEEDQKGKIFQAFSQADGSTTRKYGGTGLGLTISKQLAHLMKGDLIYNSSPGKGATFSLFVSSGVKLEEQDIIHDIGIYKRDFDSQKLIGTKFKGKILVAEDNASNQFLIRLLLEKLGIEVTIANNGREALQLAEKNKYQIIFMDMQMPDMNGYEATKEIRKKEIKTPVYALTANAMKGDENRCIESGCNGYLRKPIIKKEILRVIAKYLNKKD